MNKVISLIALCSIFSNQSYAADVVPYSIQNIKVVSPGYVELVGPGKIEVNNKTMPYEGKKYIKTINIGTLTSVPGVSNACVLAYSSEGYTESISVLKQSCDQILGTLHAAN